jgi:integrase
MTRDRDRPRARPLARGDPDYPRHSARIARPRALARRLAAALRPSEIAGLVVEHVTRHADGIELFLPWRKNDQDARGTKLWLPPGPHCALPGRGARGWLAAAAITAARVPPPVALAAGPYPKRRQAKAGRRPLPEIGTNPIDTDSIALIVKRWTELAGFDGAGFAGHSLRRGAITSGVAQGVHIARLKQFSGHASSKSLEEYVELDELRHNHPLKDVL